MKPENAQQRPSAEEPGTVGLSPARKSVSSITDPELEALYDQRDGLLWLLAASLGVTPVPGRRDPAHARMPRPEVNGAPRPATT